MSEGKTSIIPEQIAIKIDLPPELTDKVQEGWIGGIVCVKCSRCGEHETIAVSDWTLYPRIITNRTENPWDWGQVEKWHHKKCKKEIYQLKF